MIKHNQGFSGRMTAEGRAQKALDGFLKEIGSSETVERFLSGYGNVRTRATYACELALYFRWLKSKGLESNPDALIRNNLKCVYESKPTDVLTKRKHTDLLGEYINVYLMEQDSSESKRSLSSAAIRSFYESNDSALFGHWKRAEQKPEAPSPPLGAGDIRKVLLAMPMRMRTPLVVVWQSGIEINRVLEMDWSFARGKEGPVKVELMGRKNHRKGYSTFIGTDSLKHLQLLGVRGMPAYPVVRSHFRGVARKLGQQGQLDNPDLRAWTPHKLRHSFETEASHAGVKAEVRDYFLGHIGGVQWVYNHRDEIHPEDLIKEYQKIEPFVSLNPTETALKGEFASKEKEMITQLTELRSLYEELKAELRASQSERPSLQSNV